MRYISILLIAIFLVGCSNGNSVGGDELFEDGKYQEAIKAYSSYLATNPTHIKSLYNRGRSFEETGNTIKATEDFEKIIELDEIKLGENEILVFPKSKTDPLNFERIFLFLLLDKVKLFLNDKLLESFSSSSDSIPIR